MRMLENSIWKNKCLKLWHSFLAGYYNNLGIEGRLFLLTLPLLCFFPFPLIILSYALHPCPPPRGHIRITQGTSKVIDFRAPLQGNGTDTAWGPGSVCLNAPRVTLTDEDEGWSLGLCSFCVSLSCTIRGLMSSAPTVMHPHPLTPTPSRKAGQGSRERLTANSHHILSFLSFQIAKIWLFLLILTITNYHRMAGWDCGNSSLNPFYP